MNRDEILEKIRLARSGVADAEGDLGRLLHEIETARRAEKTTISEALHEAFQKLGDAREHLARLETMIRGEDA